MSAGAEAVVRSFGPGRPPGVVVTVAFVGPVDLAGVEPIDSDESSVDWRRRVVVGAVGIAVVAVLVAVARRWWRSGGARRTVKDLAEVSAVALADVIVDEFLPAA